MPHVNPTPDDIRLDFPVFTDVDDDVIQRRIDRTMSWIDETWLETDYTWAVSLLTAHYLTEDGMGRGTDAELASQGLTGVSRLKSGTLDVTFKEGGGGNANQFGGTSYGQRFYTLLRKNKGGVYVAAGGGCGVGSQSTDVPWAWATGGFGL